MRRTAESSGVDQAEKRRRAAHLRDAMVHRAQERGDAPADIARTMDMSVGHWYRVRKEPERLASLTLERLQAVATYVGWPKARVMVAVGWLEQPQLEEALLQGKTLRDALSRLQRGPLGNALAVPLSKAAPDHQALFARLFLLIEGNVLSTKAPD